MTSMKSLTLRFTYAEDDVLVDSSNPEWLKLMVEDRAGLALLDLFRELGIQGVTIEEIAEEPHLYPVRPVPPVVLKLKDVRRA